MTAEREEKTAQVEAGRLLNERGVVVSVVFREVEWSEVKPEKEAVPGPLYV